MICVLTANDELSFLWWHLFLHCQQSDWKLTRQIFKLHSTLLTPRPLINIVFQIINVLCYKRTSYSTVNIWNRWNPQEVKSPTSVQGHRMSSKSENQIPRPSNELLGLVHNQRKPHCLSARRLQCQKDYLKVRPYARSVTVSCSASTQNARQLREQLHNGILICQHTLKVQMAKVSLDSKSTQETLTVTFTRASLLHSPSVLKHLQLQLQ